MQHGKKNKKNQPNWRGERGAETQSFSRTSRQYGVVWIQFPLPIHPSRATLPDRYFFYRVVEITIVWTEKDSL